MAKRLLKPAAAILALGLAAFPALSQTPPVGGRAPVAAASAAATPRLANGKPDLSGYWGGRGGGPAGPAGAAPPPEEDGDVFAVLVARDGDLMNFENDSFIEQKAAQNMPLYKPEYWAKVRDLDLNGNRTDPTIHCLPAGVPRMGPPTRIIAFPDEVILFNNTVFRVIKIGKPRNKADLLIETWNGIPEARWDGDTLVIESIGFNDQSWLGWGGYFHSFDLKVTETFRREGDRIFYTAVADDPVLLEPWKVNSVTINKNTNPNATIAEATPCSDRDSNEIPNNLRG